MTSSLSFTYFSDRRLVLCGCYLLLLVVMAGQYKVFWASAAFEVLRSIYRFVDLSNQTGLDCSLPVEYCTICISCSDCIILLSVIVLKNPQKILSTQTCRPKSINYRSPGLNNRKWFPTLHFRLYIVAPSNEVFALSVMTCVFGLLQEITHRI